MYKWEFRSNIVGNRVKRREDIVRKIRVDGNQTSSGGQKTNRWSLLGREIGVDENMVGNVTDN